MLRRKFVRNDYLRRGVFLLPNILTSLNLFCGFYSILESIDRRFVIASLAIIISGILDSIDGRVARAVNATSHFGVEYDSMSDLVSFGIAPGLLMYLWILESLGLVGSMATFLFTICGALRLARFNSCSRISGDNLGYFIGLPITAAAGILAFTVLFFFEIGLSSFDNSYLLLLITCFLSFLMVSNIRYVSFKHHEIFKGVWILFLFFMVFIFVLTKPSVIFFIFGILYMLSGPFFCIFNSFLREERSSRLEKSDISDGLE